MPISNKTLGHFGWAVVIAASSLLMSACVKIEIPRTELAPVAIPPTIPPIIEALARARQIAIHYDPKTHEFIVIDHTGKRAEKLKAAEIERRVSLLKARGYVLHSDRRLTITRKKNCVFAFSDNGKYQEFCGALPGKIKLFSNNLGATHVRPGDDLVGQQADTISRPATFPRSSIRTQLDSTVLSRGGTFRLFDRSYRPVKEFDSKDRPIAGRIKGGKSIVIRIREFSRNPSCLVFTGSDGSGYITCAIRVTYAGAQHPGGLWQARFIRTFSGVDQLSSGTFWIYYRASGNFPIYYPDCWQFGNYEIPAGVIPDNSFLRVTQLLSTCLPLPERNFLLARELPDLGLFIELSGAAQPVIKAVGTGECSSPTDEYNYQETGTGTVSTVTRGDTPCSEGLITITDPMIVASREGLIVRSNTSSDGGIGFLKNSLTLSDINKTYSGFLIRYPDSGPLSREHVSIGFSSASGELMRLNVADNNKESLGDSIHYTITFTGIDQGKITAESGICHETTTNGTNHSGHTPRQFNIITSEREGVVVLYGFARCEEDASLRGIELILVASSDPDTTTP